MKITFANDQAARESIASRVAPLQLAAAALHATGKPANIDHATTIFAVANDYLAAYRDHFDKPLPAPLRLAEG